MDHDGSDEELIDWRIEAEAVIRDVKNHLQRVKISDKFESDETKIYLEVETLERHEFIIELTSQGFKLYREQPQQEAEAEFFETPYALLDSVSPKFRESFANELSRKLSAFVVDRDKV